MLCKGRDLEPSVVVSDPRCGTKTRSRTLAVKSLAAPEIARSPKMESKLGVIKNTERELFWGQNHRQMIT